MADAGQPGDFVWQRDRVIRRQIVSLALPIVANNLLQRGVGVVDTIMVGHVSAASLAAVGLCQVLILTATAFTHCFAVGSAVIVARHTGAEEYDPRRWVANTALTGGALAGLFFGLLGATFGGPFAAVVGARGEVLAESTRYLEILGIAYVFMVLIQVSSAVFQGAGDSRTPLRVVIFVNLIHILIAYPLIFGKWGMPALGVRGAALGTLISEAVGTVLLIALLARRGLVALRARLLVTAQLRRIVRLGIPVLGERLLTQAMQILYARLILGFEVATYAAHQVGLNIEAMSFLSGLGFSQAATTMVGQHLGARLPSRATRSGYQSGIVAVGVMSAFGLTFLLFPRFWVSLFTSDPEVVAYGVTYCRIAAFMQPPIALAMVMAGALRGAGDTRGPMWSVLVGAWCFRLPVAWIVGVQTYQSIAAVWMAMVIDWYLRAIFLFARYRRAAWRDIGV
jgi:putative MATE family efflux protein